jgi:hypothetical protein
VANPKILAHSATATTKPTINQGINLEPRLNQQDIGTLFTGFLQCGTHYCLNKDDLVTLQHGCVTVT